MSPATTPRHEHRTIPAWVIVALGIVATGAGVLWASGVRDDLGETLLTDQAAKVLVALIGGGATLLGVLLQRMGEVRHQVKNSHGTNLRDDMDDHTAALAQVRELAEHAVRAARKASDDTVQLREDVQALRSDLGGTQSDIRGIRKDFGRLADALTKKES